MAGKRRSTLTTAEKVKKLYSERVKIPKKNKDESCWEWTGAYGADKRGRIITTSKDAEGKKRQKFLSAHRYTWMINFGEIPAGMGVATTCTNKSCQNPKHLRLITHRESMKAMMVNDKHHKGSRHGRSVLKEEDVIRIRKLWSTGLMSQRAISRLYDVSIPLIGFIVNGIVWRHLPHFEPVVWKESPTKPDGNFGKTSRSKLRRFSDEKAREIRNRYNSGENSAALAKEYKTSINTIIWIAKAKIYTDI